MAKYDVKQVSEFTDISVDTVHHYVKKFRKYFKGLERGKFNRLIFSDCDVDFLMTIRTLNKMENLTIKEINNKFKNEGIPEVTKQVTINNEENISESSNINNFPIEKIEGVENALISLKSEFEKFSEVETTLLDMQNNYKEINSKNAVVTQRTEDIKKMMTQLYTKLSHIERKQEKIMEEVNTSFWTKIKSIMMKPVRIPFLWKL
ncbi:MAG: MerR family transcriptional regulator [Candidatus Muiribacteriota bacterium]